jgi:hypothetical protein
LLQARGFVALIPQSENRPELPDDRAISACGFRELVPAVALMSLRVLVIVGKERPHQGAQLRFTDIDGHRFTCMATSTKAWQLPDLELRYRRRARCEDQSPWKTAHPAR